MINFLWDKSIRYCLYSIDLCYLYHNQWLCLYWLSSFSIKKLSEIPVGSGGGSKHGDKIFDKVLGIGIQDFLMNLMSCPGFLKNINSVVILKYPKRVLEYYFSKGFTILECNVNNLEKLPNEVKQGIHAEETNNSYKVMTYINKIPSTSKTLKSLVVNKSFHYSYIQRELNNKK